MEWTEAYSHQELLAIQARVQQWIRDEEAKGFGADLYFIRKCKRVLENIDVKLGNNATVPKEGDL